LGSQTIKQLFAKIAIEVQAMDIFSTPFIKKRLVRVPYRSRAFTDANEMPHRGDRSLPT
jgi:hypothetical protein